MSESDFYYATYCQLDTQNGDSTVFVDGNAVVVGSELSLTEQTHVTNRGKEVQRIVLSRGDQALGFLPDNVYKQVSRRLGEGWECKAYASAVAFNKPSESYWVEAAIFCFRPQDAETFERFISTIEKRIAKGEHPAIALSAKDLARVMETKGEWAQTASQKLPKLEKGTAYYKTKQTMTEGMALAAANGNKGCYVGLYLVVFCIIFSIVWFFFLR